MLERWWETIFFPCKEPQCQIKQNFILKILKIVPSDFMMAMAADPFS